MWIMQCSIQSQTWLFRFATSDHKCVPLLDAQTMMYKKQKTKKNTPLRLPILQDTTLNGINDRLQTRICLAAAQLSTTELVYSVLHICNHKHVFITSCRKLIVYHCVYKSMDVTMLVFTSPTVSNWNINFPRPSGILTTIIIIIFLTIFSKNAAPPPLQTQRPIYFKLLENI